MSCPDCHGARAVPDDLSGGYGPGPSCVIDAGVTFVVLEEVANDADAG